MSNLYDKAREGFVSGEIVWKDGGSVVKALLVRGYAFSVAHKFVSEMIGAGGTIVASDTLNSLTNTNGVCDAADAVWEATPEGTAIPHIILIQASAVTGGADLPASQQRLIACIDRGSGVTLSITPNGQNITGSWSPGADRIFRF
jgi:hypothetical protein